MRVSSTMGAIPNVMTILASPIFRVLHIREAKTLDLAEVLALLATSGDVEFPGLRPHQQHAWYAFLVQLAALVAVRTGRSSLDLAPAEWRGALVDLAGGSERAWELVVDDLAEPAFLQPPVPEGTLSSFKTTHRQPDSIDVLVTAKNHEVKRAVIASPLPEHWVYALVTLQTMQGYSGKRNYGIARMNKGHGSRPSVGYAGNLDLPGRFRRDVGLWLEWRPKLCEGLGYPERAGHALLWTKTWDGEKRLQLASCDPFFIEICRRVRLTRDGVGAISARVATTSVGRVNADHALGNTGDIWTPVSTEGKGLTVDRAGFSYRRMADLLLSGNYVAPALSPQDSDGKQPIVVAEVLSRGEGRTDGYHYRVLPVPEKICLKLGSVTERASLGDLAQQRIDRARSAEQRVLRRALCALLQGGGEKLDFRDTRTRPWLDRLDRKIDAIFFEELWKDIERSLEEGRQHWDSVLFDLAQAELEHAIKSAPVPISHKPKAVAQAELMFRRLARKHLEAAFSPQEEAGKEADG